MGGLTLQTALKLGRVSNLPTVWSNVIAGMVLAGAVAPPWSTWLLVVLACSLMYVAGMFLNDAFDAEIDAAERAERPIPQGEVPRNTVFAWGFGMLAAGALLLFLVSLGAGLAGLFLAAAIVLYDWYHKDNPLSPVLMGFCRMLVYAVAGYAISAPPDIAVLWGALAVLAYLIGLTYVAKQENLAELGQMWPLAFLTLPVIYLALHAVSLAAWLTLLGLIAWGLYALSHLRPQVRNVKLCVVSLIAGISLLDAALIASTGAVLPAVVAIACFAAALAGQRHVSGT